MRAVKHPRDRSGEGGRYETLVKIAAGGMGSVYVARARGALGFEQLVAIKHPHEHLLETRGFKKALLAEASVASKIRHANVVAIRDVDIDGDVISLVMDYVEGSSLSDLTAESPRLPIGTSMRIVLDACAGLHAAHEVLGEDGLPLGLVHRDVSPQNILVGTDGVARITDFGIAKCVSETRDQTTQGILKGKLSYMAPDQMDGSIVDRRADIFAIGVVMWELLTGDRLFKGGNDAETVGRILSMKVEAPSALNRDVPAALDAIVLRAIEKKREDRFATAEELGAAIENISTADVLATHRQVAAWVRDRVGPLLAERNAAIRNARAGEPAVDLSHAASSPTDTHSGVQVNDALPRPSPISTTEPAAPPAPPLGPIPVTPFEIATTIPRPVGPTGTLPTNRFPAELRVPTPAPDDMLSTEGGTAILPARANVAAPAAKADAKKELRNDAGRDDDDAVPMNRPAVRWRFVVMAATFATTIGIGAAIYSRSHDAAPEGDKRGAVAEPAGSASPSASPGASPGASASPSAGASASPTPSPSPSPSARPSASAVSSVVPAAKGARPPRGGGAGGGRDVSPSVSGRIKAPPNPYQ